MFLVNCHPANFHHNDGHEKAGIKPAFKGGGASGTGSGRQRLFQQLVQFGELRLTDVALDDVAILADDEGGRGQLDVAEGLGQRVLRVECDLEGQLAGFGVVNT